MSANGVFGSTAALLGHRGMGRGLVDGVSENTLDSFLAAVALGIDWVEVDVRRTKDDVLVVAHNPARDDGRFWADLSGAQAQASGVLTLEGLLEALPDGIGVDFDVKTSLEDAPRDRCRTTMGLLAPIVRGQATRRPVLVTSFDAAALEICHEQAPQVPRGLLTWVEFPVGHAVASAAHLGVQVLALHGGSLKPNRREPKHLQRPLRRVVDVAHASGLELMAWCPGVAFARRLVAAGVDALCVNDVPTVLRELREPEQRQALSA
jgi:glycerophosphoryl diester phosphodiesterase